MSASASGNKSVTCRCRSKSPAYKRETQIDRIACSFKIINKDQPAATLSNLWRVTWFQQCSFTISSDRTHFVGMYKKEVYRAIGSVLGASVR